MDEEIVVVVVRRNHRFQWYRSDRDLWVLDWRRWAKDFTDAGHHVPEFKESDRFGIEVVNDATADAFLLNMTPFLICKDQLAENLSELFPFAESWWDVGDLFPIMFVDFDNRHVCACYPEGTRMERYVPDGWTSEFEDFQINYPEDRFPKSEKYWVQGDRDLLAELIKRETPASD